MWYSRIIDPKVLILGSAAGVGFTNDTKKLRVARTKKGSKDILSASVINHPALEYGYPQNSYVAASESFVTSFDFRTRNPQWVMEKLTASSLRKHEANRHEFQFVEAELIPERMRSKLKDFAGSGYDRGHMAAAADQTHSERALRDSFCLANISPQIGQGLNRDYWARLEKFTRDILLKKGAADELYIVTGPLFLPRKTRNNAMLYDHTAIGQPPSMVAVPTHFYKIILAATKPRSFGSGGGYAVAAFVVPNQAITPETPLTHFIAPFEAVEAAAGVIFFSKLLTPQRRDVLAAAEERWLNNKGRGKTPQLLLENKPNTHHHRHPRKHNASSPSSDITHLCDRHDCELISARWLENFKNKKEHDRKSTDQHHHLLTDGRAYDSKYDHKEEDDTAY